MSIDYLLELERHIAGGREHFACQGTSSGEWLITRCFYKINEVAQCLADKWATPLMVYQLLPRDLPHNNCPYLVPSRIGGNDLNRINFVEWTLVETTENAENVRDVTFGPAPYFAADAVEAVPPKALSTDASK